MDTDPAKGGMACSRAFEWVLRELRWRRASSGRPLARMVNDMTSGCGIARGDQTATQAALRRIDTLQRCAHGVVWSHTLLETLWPVSGVVEAEPILRRFTGSQGQHVERRDTAAGGGACPPVGLRPGRRGFEGVHPPTVRTRSTFCARACRR